MSDRITRRSIYLMHAHCVLLKHYVCYTERVFGASPIGKYWITGQKHKKSCGILRDLLYNRVPSEHSSNFKWLQQRDVAQRD